MVTAEKSLSGKDNMQEQVRGLNRYVIIVRRPAITGCGSVE